MGLEWMRVELRWVWSCIRDDPGCTVRDIMHATGFTHSKARAALESLTGAGMVHEYRVGRTHHFFSSNYTHPSVWKQYVVLRCKEHTAFHGWLLKCGPTLQYMARKHMARLFGWSRDRMRGAVARLVDAGLIHTDRRGKWIILMAKPMKHTSASNPETDQIDWQRL